MLVKISPGGAVLPTYHITIVPAIRFIMNPDIAAIVVIAVISY